MLLSVSIAADAMKESDAADGRDDREDRDERDEKADGRGIENEHDGVSFGLDGEC